MTGPSTTVPAATLGVTAGYAAQRARLANLLAEAAEIEHNVLCQYLFAAFSLKRSPSEGGVDYRQLELMRRWHATLMLVARQEMEHLAIVCNLLTAIGEAPNLRRHDFPVSQRHYPVPFTSRLTTFSLDTVQRFIAIEMPDPTSGAPALLERHAIPAGNVEEFRTIADLYAEIGALFRSLDASGTPLFIGPPGAEIGTTGFIPVPLRGISLPPNPRIYDVLVVPVTDLASAAATISQVVDEGEGGGDVNEATSHFGRFVAMYRELRDELRRDPAFAPARPVVTNPRVHPGPEGAHGVTVLTDPLTRRVAELFDGAYATMLLMLIRFLAQADASPAELAALQQGAFFPMMTTVIRPVGELLTQLPAHPESVETAGPSFELARRVQYLPHRTAAWQILVLELDHLAGIASALAADAALPAAMQPRMQLVFENLTRMRINFAAAVGLPST